MSKSNADDDGEQPNRGGTRSEPNYAEMVPESQDDWDREDYRENLWDSDGLARAIKQRAQAIRSYHRDMRHDVAEAIARAEFGYGANASAKELDYAEETVGKWIENAMDEYGHPYGFVKPPEEIGGPLTEHDSENDPYVVSGIDVDPDGYEFPDGLIERRQWLTWETIDRGGKTTKIPYVPGDPENDHTNPDSLLRFEKAHEYVNMSPSHKLGYSFQPGGPFVGIDFDDCRDPETGELDDWVAEIVDRAESWAQVSTSGTGIHLFLRGNLKNVVKRDDEGIEMYERERFFAMTDNTLERERVTDEITEAQGLIDELYNEYYDPTTPVADGSDGSSGTSEFEPGEYDADSRFDKLRITDVFPETPVGSRCAHPVHGSKRTGANFLAEGDGGRGTCWRCNYGSSQGTGLNAQILLAMDALGIDKCDTAKQTYRQEDHAVWAAWLNAKQNYEHVLLGDEPPPYRAMRWICDTHVDADLDDGGRDAWVAYRVACAWIATEHSIDVEPDPDNHEFK